jgi:hypothetical protein
MTPLRVTAPLLVLLAGCYTYRALPALAPAPQTQVAIVLSDQGRVGIGPVMGSGIARVEGALVGSNDSEYMLRIAGVTDIRGRETHWSGESVSLRRSWVDNAYERRFSKPRTYALVGVLVAGFATIVVTRHLFGIGGPLVEPGGGGGGGSTQ